MGPYMKFELKWLAWEITRRCNLRCVHCRSSSELEVSKHPDSDFHTATKIIDSICDFAKPVVVLTGGEPLLRDDVFEIATYGTKKGLRMCLATNGTLLTKAHCQKIIKAGIKMVALSLDGASASTHDTFRHQAGAFESTINATKLLKEHRIDFLINSSFTKHNQQDIVPCFRLAKKLGAKAWYLFMVIPTGRGEELLEELIPPKDYDEILAWHYQMEQEEHEMLIRPTCAPHYYRYRFERYKKEKNTRKSRPLSFSPGGSKGCLAGQTIALLDVDGNLMPCSYLPLSAGNIHQTDLETLWNDSTLFKNFRDFSKYKDRCGACEYIKICGGCRARAYMMEGDAFKSDPFCQHVPDRLNA
jgi:radical SAM protein with 4Fe4S-binding SPASM domain